MATRQEEIRKQRAILSTCEGILEAAQSDYDRAVIQLSDARQEYEAAARKLIELERETGS